MALRRSGPFLTSRLIPVASEAGATTARPIRLRACLVDVQAAAIEVFAIDGSNGLFALCVVWHLHEAKTTRLTRITIRDDVDTINSTVRLKQRTDSFFRSPKTEVSDEYVFQVTLPFGFEDG